jgi:hypothetical protein
MSDLSSTELSIVPTSGVDLRRATVPSMNDVLTIQTMCKAAAASGLVKSKASSIAQKEADAFFISMYGYELGFPPMTALQLIYAVDGKPTLSAQGMVSLLRRHGFSVELPDPGTVKDSATVKVRRPGGEWRAYTYTLDMASKAGLTGKDNWRKYPAEMLIWRAAATGCRMEGGDATAGLYMIEEMNPDAEIDPVDGSLIVSGSATKVEWPTAALVTELVNKAMAAFNISREEVARYAGVGNIDDLTAWSKYAGANAAGQAIKAAHAVAHPQPAPEAAPAPQPMPEPPVVTGTSQPAAGDPLQTLRDLLQSQLNMTLDEAAAMLNVQNHTVKESWKPFGAPSGVIVAIQKKLAQQPPAAPKSTLDTLNTAVWTESQMQSWREIIDQDYIGLDEATVANWLEYAGSTVDKHYSSLAEARAMLRAAAVKNLTQVTCYKARYQGQYTEFVTAVGAIKLWGRDQLRALGEDYAAFAETWEKGKEYLFSEANLAPLGIDWEWAGKDNQKYMQVAADGLMSLAPESDMPF